MKHKTNFYKDYVIAWQGASDRRDAHNRYNEITGHTEYTTPYSLFMEKIHYMKGTKGVELKDLPHLDRAQADWDEIREFAINHQQEST